MTFLYHITPRELALAARESGQYVPTNFAREGFIHCSYRHQLDWVVQTHFRGQEGLVVLEINRDMLHTPVIDENLEGGETLFPHVYGPLPWTAVCSMVDLVVVGPG